jgi:hypothetical protein
MSAMDAICRKKGGVFSYLVYKYLQCADRRFWVHQLVSSGLLKGAISSFNVDLSDDETKFFNYFRMSKRCFEELAGRIADSIRSQDTNMRLAIGPLEMLAVTLRYVQI